MNGQKGGGEETKGRERNSGIHCFGKFLGKKFLLKIPRARVRAHVFGVSSVSLRVHLVSCLCLRIASDFRSLSGNIIPECPKPETCPQRGTPETETHSHRQITCARCQAPGHYCGMVLAVAASRVPWGLSPKYPNVSRNRPRWRTVDA